MSCFHCRQTALEIETLRQAALDEINIYRKLLRLPPQSTLTVHGSTRQSHNRTTPSGKRLSLQTMPTEILDRIASFVGSESIMQLCHSLPELKHISRTIHDVAMAFPRFYRGPKKIWPEFEFPCGGDGDESRGRGYSEDDDEEDEENDQDYFPSEIPVRHMYSIYNLTSLLSRYGGSARFSGGDVAYLDNILPLLPKHVYIMHSLDDDPSLYDEEFLTYLEKLKESKVSVIQMLPIPSVLAPNEWTASARTKYELSDVKTLLLDLNIYGLSFVGRVPSFLEECVLPNMRNLKELFLHNHPPSVAVLTQCKKLKSVRCIDTRCVDPQEISDLVHHLPQSSLTYVAFEADIFLNEEQTRHLCDYRGLEAIGWKIICHREFESTVKVEWFK